MKRLTLIILVLLFVFSSTAVSAFAEEDYQQLYLEQKIQSLRMELQALQMRFAQIQNELPQALAELREYTSAEAIKKEEVAQGEVDELPKEN